MPGHRSRRIEVAGTREHRSTWSAWGAIVCTMLATLGSGVSLEAVESTRALDGYLEAAWTTSAGLPQNGVLSLAQSANGYLWVGTQEGLARFDGATFRVFDRGSYPAFEDQFITAVAPAEDGSIWVGTREGLIRLGATEVTRIGVEDGLPSAYIRSLEVGGDGTLWVGTYGGGLARLSAEGIRVYDEREGLRDPFVRALAVDRRGTVWIGTSSGLARLDEDGLEMVDASDGPGDRLIRCLAVDGRGRLWIGAEDGGLFRAHDRQIERVAEGEFETVNALAVDGAGNVWLAVETNTLARIDLLDRIETTETATANALLVDQEGSLWAGTQSGLIQLKERRVRVVGGEASGLAVRTVYETAAGRVWVGSDAAGLRELSEGSLTVPHSLGALSATSVRSIVEDTGGDLWIGTREGLVRMSEAGLEKFGVESGLPSATVNVLEPSADGRLWVGTAGGLVIWEGGRFSGPDPEVAAVLEDARVRSLLVTQDGLSWVGTESGLARVGREPRLFDRGDGLAGDFVLSLHEGDNGRIWVGTAAGLSLLTDEGFVSFSAAQGVPQRAVYRILEDSDQNLWLCTSRGIFRLSPGELVAVAEGRAPAVHPLGLTEEDGLVSGQCSGGTQPAGWKRADGKLLFPTQRGLAIIDPGRLPRHSLAPTTLIDSVRVDNRPLDPTGDLALDPGRPTLEINYTAPTFKSPRAVVFRYRVDGMHNDWIYAGGRRQVVFGSVPPGTYRFRVEAGSGEGYWDERGASLAFSVRPSLVERTDVRVLVVALLLALVSGLYGLRLQQAKRRQRLLEAQVDERTVQLKHANEVLAGLAATDALTGITNYRRFQELLPEEWRRGRRRETPLALILLDIDHFKGFNDTYGHAAGDSCLRRVAEALDRMTNRQGDVVARYGGEEFVVLLPETGEESAAMMADRFRRAVEELRIPNSSSQVSPVVTVSAGVAALVPSPDLEPGALFELADQALYEAKRSGRNKVRSRRLEGERRDQGDRPRAE